MTTIDQDRLASGNLPVDLRKFLGEAALIRLVLEAVQTVDWPKLPLEVSEVGGRGSQMMLTLLSYCYASGIYGSQDIEWANQNDKMVSYICGGEELDWLTIRRFRRQHVELLRTCIAYILRKAPAVKPGAADASLVRLFEVELNDEIACAARNRIDAAIMLDAATSDF